MSSLVVLLIGSGASAAVAAEEREDIELWFDTYAVEAINVTPGAETAWLGISRELENNAYTKIHRFHQTLVDDDEDGTVTFYLERPLARSSMWTVVELETGRSALSSAGARTRPMKSYHAAFEAQGGRFDVASRSFEVLWVRPRVGAWTGRFADGDRNDLDAVRDGIFRGSVESLQPRPGGREPDLLRPQGRDVVVFIDLRDLRSAILIVPAEVGR